MDIRELVNKLEQAKGQRILLQTQSKAAQRHLKQFNVQRVQWEKALTVLQESALITQEQLQYRIGELVTLALNSVYDKPYEFRLEFDTKRNKPEAKIVLLCDGMELSPLEDCGGGLADIVAFALQISLWFLQTNRTRNVLILDEPLKWLKGGDLPWKGAKMMQELSHKLGIQLIIVSHSEEQIAYADKVFHVTQTDGVSHVKEQ